MKEKVDVIGTDVFTYGEIIERFHKLQNVTGLKGEKILFARAKNVMALRRFVIANDVNSRIPISEAFRSYNMEVTMLNEKYPDKTIKDYAIELNELFKKHRDSIYERDIDVKAYNQLMDSVIPNNELPSFHSVSGGEDISDLTQEQYDAIWWFLEE